MNPIPETTDDLLKVPVFVPVAENKKFRDLLATFGSYPYKPIVSKETFINGKYYVLRITAEELLVMKLVLGNTCSFYNND